MRNSFKTLLAGCALWLGAVLPAQAQDYGAMVQQGVAAMNANILRGQQQVNQIVQQRMQDPAVQQAWQRYVQQSGGRPQMNYASFTYNYIYTNGFSSAGIAHARANEAGMQQREMQAWRAYQQAQGQRAAAMQGQRDSYSAHQQEAGRGLMGNSTYGAPSAGAPAPGAAAGETVVLPHTWQRNGTYEHQGKVYHVDASGSYYVRASDGWWYPLAAR